jgi:hypothetical protein
MAAKLLMMDFEIFQRSTTLATPGISVEYRESKRGKDQTTRGRKETRQAIEIGSLTLRADGRSWFPDDLARVHFGAVLRPS